MSTPRKKRSGHLFQGRFKSIGVDRESDLLELSRYLHLNPVRARMVAIGPAVRPLHILLSGSIQH